MTKAIALPKGFKKHDGGNCPVDPNTIVEPLIRTAEGIGSGGITFARMHEWNRDAHEGHLGEVVAYRLAVRGEDPRFHGTHRFKVKGIA